MTKNKTSKKRTHPGLCIDLLDDEHKLLVREIALLLRIVEFRRDGQMHFGVLGAVKKRCSLCAAESQDSLETFDPDKYDALPLVHRADCIALHAERLINTDQALRLLAILEHSCPITPLGKAYHQVRDEIGARAEAERRAQEVAP